MEFRGWVGLSLAFALVPAAVGAAQDAPPAAPKNNPGRFFGVDQYPVEALRHHEQGRVVAMLIIDATGTPTHCTVTTSSGSASLDVGTCNIALTRVRFTPARDDAGHAVAGTYSLSIRWVLP